MRMIIEIEGGCVVCVQADTEHVGPLEVFRVDADCREQGDDAVQELSFSPVTPEEFDTFLEQERQTDDEAAMDNEAEEEPVEDIEAGPSITVEPLD